MFEVVLTLCAALEGGPCRDALLPGYEAATQEQCEDGLAARAPDLAAFASDDGPAQRGGPRCQEAGASLEVEEVAPGVFVHVGLVEEPDAANGGDVSNVGFVIGAESVAVIDSGSARRVGEELWRSVRNRTDLPVSHVVLTHMHPDHVFGATPFAESGAEVVGHETLPRALADRQENYRESLERLIGAGAFLGTAAPRVTRTVDDGMEIDLGGRLLTLQAWPTAHTETDVTVLDAVTGTFFVGDLVFDRHTPALDGSLRGWLAALEDIAELGAARIVPGHGGPALPGDTGTEETHRYLEVLARDTLAAIEAGTRMGDAVLAVAAEEAARWELFDAYNPRNATVAFTELEWE